MEKMPTAEEYLASKQYDWVEDVNTTECMIEFAKLHVEQALKEASEKVSVLHTNYKGSHKIEFPYSVDNYSDLHLDKDSILNSYSIENIK